MTTLPVDNDQAGAWVPLSAAARALGISEKTTRRRVRSGGLLSRQVSTQHGPAYEVWIPEGGQVATQESTVPGQGAQWVDTPATLELVRLVGQLQADVVTKAEAAAMWQARAEMLAGQVQHFQERIHALEAPREPRTVDHVTTPAPEASNEPVGASEPGNSHQGPSTPPRRWWQHLLGRS